MRYFRTIWSNPGKRFPFESYSQVNDLGIEDMRIEFWPDGHVGYARAEGNLELGGTFLAEGLFPEDYKPSNNGGVIEELVDEKEFNRFWQIACKLILHQG